MATVRSILFALFFYPWTVLCVLAALPATAIGPGPLKRVVRGWTRGFGWAAAAILGIRYRLEGAMPAGPAIVAAKHEAMYETLLLVTVLGDPVPVLKQELAAIPLFGLAVRRWGSIPVDRAGSAAALRTMVKAAKAAIAAGRTILIFPEGTRVLPGERPPLRPGFAGLYRATGLPVVPVAIDSGRVWPKGLVKRPGVVTVRFGAPVPPGLPRREVEAAVHAAINALNGAA